MSAAIQATKPVIPSSSAVVFEAAESRMLLSVVFGEPVPLAVGEGPVAVVVADFDGNGTQDIATANFLDGSVSVVRRAADGGVLGTQTVSVGAGPRGLAAGRIFPGNQRPDLVVSNFADGTVSVLRNNGQGSFSLEQTIGVGEGPWSVALASLASPQGSLLDIVITLYTEGAVALLRNDGSGSFGQVQKLAMPAPPLDITAASGLAGSGIGFAATLVESQAIALIGVSSGQLTMAGTLAVEGKPWGIAAADLTGNGAPDLAVTLLENARIAVLRNTGGGNFAAAVDYETAARPWAVVGTDLDQDGRVDLVVVSNSLGVVEFFRNVGGGELNRSSSFELEAPLTAIAAGDMDGDGWTDVLVTQYDLAAASLVGVTSARSIQQAGPGRAVAGSGSNAGLLTVTTINSDDHLIAFLQQTGGGWGHADLGDLAGPVTGQVEAWHDPKDGLAYAAATASEGLLLYARDGAGAWTVRNLSQTVAGAAVIVGDVTVFISTDDLVTIAGLKSNGDLVMFRQDGTKDGQGRFNWVYVDIAADHLRANGQQMPQFVGWFVSYVTAWNGQNIAGLDSSGAIQAVWWSPGMSHWRVDNLSAITGAPPLSGGLAPYLTPWGGINLAGADASGELLVTWWVPEFGADWLTNNLTAQFDGPSMVAESVSSYVTSWGGLNVAGIDEHGNLTVYWWAPGLTEWIVSPLSELIPDATVPEGRIRGVTVAATGSINLLGAAPNGDVLRYWWQPGDAPWAIQNLTDLI